MNPDDLMALINNYYNDPNSFSDEEAEVIAGLTRQLGMPFDRERKPIRKFLYGAGEMATFGLLPDSLKPHSRGQDVYGETAIDAIASGAGSLLGLAGGIGGAYRAGRGIMRSDRVKDIANPAIENVRNRFTGRPSIDRFFDRAVGNVGYY
tara:strand:+ start:6838 stop:7287 length:450 start_codon:yes stop_codon:yes gene_type:complete